MLLRPMQRIVFKFIRISVDGEIIDNDTKTIVWMENISSVFKFIRISVDGASDLRRVQGSHDSHATIHAFDVSRLSHR